MVITPTIVPLLHQVRWTLMLIVPRQDTQAARLEDLASKTGYTPKTEFHITILGRKAGEALAEKIESLDKETRKEKVDALTQLIAQTEWMDGLTLGGKLYKVEREQPVDGGGKEIREAYIELAKVPAAEAFIKGVNEIFGLELSPPFPHVTLFTSGTHKSHAKGIGIATEKEFKSLDPTEIR
jgi:hypothetical protein